MSIVIVIMPPVDEKLQRVLVTLLFLDEQSSFEYYIEDKVSSAW